MMIELPPANYPDRIATMLTELGCGWSRNDTLVSHCHTDGPCETHPDRGECCKNARGVSYLVNSGPLEGTWCAWGSNADEHVFSRMVTKLDDDWRRHLDECHVLAQALRSIGK